MDFQVPCFPASQTFSVVKFCQPPIIFTPVKICLKSSSARWNGGVIEFSAAKFLGKFAPSEVKESDAVVENSILPQLSPIFPLLLELGIWATFP